VNRQSVESPVLTVVVQSSLHVVQVMAIWLFLRGHQEPGGGFVAGLVVVAVIALRGLAFGFNAANAVFPLPFHLLLGLGLTFSFGTVLVPIFLGEAFMKSDFGHIDLPLLGDVEWATAAIFDLGVFLVVVGSMKAILLYIAEEKSEDQQRPGESERGARRA
jgi:multisubunit Na+/H+ antiporter MnhB subunit